MMPGNSTTISKMLVNRLDDEPNPLLKPWRQPEVFFPDEKKWVVRTLDFQR